MKFSANLGFLWKELDLPDAIRAAADNGFDAVECHYPYEIPAAEIKVAMDDTGMTMIGLNTLSGDLKLGERGLCAIPGREKEARLVIDQAVQYAAVISCWNIHVLAGITDHESAHTTFVDNLGYACDLASREDITIVVEPLNTLDNPGYFLTSTVQARQLIDEVGAGNLGLMFDCYHIEIMQGEVLERLAESLDMIRHIQFASVPGRNEPDTGHLDYRLVFDFLGDRGYSKPLGAEYVPLATTEAGLGWMNSL